MLFYRIKFYKFIFVLNKLEKYIYNRHYLQETLTEVIPRLNIIRDKLLRLQDEFSKLCDPMYLEQLKEKISDIITRLANTEKRLRLCKGSEVNIPL